MVLNVYCFHFVMRINSLLLFRCLILYFQPLSRVKVLVSTHFFSFLPFTQAFKALMASLSVSFFIGFNFPCNFCCTDTVFVTVEQAHKVLFIQCLIPGGRTKCYIKCEVHNATRKLYRY